MSLSLSDMVMIGMRLIQYRNEISDLLEKIFGKKQVGRATQPVPVYDVKWVQQALNHLMHPTKLTVDGVMGEQTREVIKRYQAMRGLQDDGWLGPVTMASLDADIRKSHNA